MGVLLTSKFARHVHARYHKNVLDHLGQDS